MVQPEGMNRAYSYLALAALLVGCSPGGGGSSGGGGSTGNLASESTTTSAAPAFGATAQEVEAREAEIARKGLGDYWVTKFESKEYSAPNGKVVNTVYYGQKLTAYRKANGWVRTTEPQFTARWSKLSDLSTKEPPPRKDLAADPATEDSRIAPDAFGKPGENGLTKRDIEILRKGAKLAVTTRSDCPYVSIGDKSIKGRGYFVTCNQGDVRAHNVFFTAKEVAAAKLP